MPTDFLSIDTYGFFCYLPFYNTFSRAAFGNPDYRPGALDPTIGSGIHTDFPPPFAAGPANFYRTTRGLTPPERGYVDYTAPDGSVNYDMVWIHPDAPPYAFIARLDAFTGDEPLTAADVTAITNYRHHIDRVAVDIAAAIPDAVLVVQETAYPGWTAAVNGQPAQIESVGGLIGVRLPPGEAVRVEFAYRPLLLYIGALVSGVFIAVFLLLRVRIE